MNTSSDDPNPTTQTLDLARWAKGFGYSGWLPVGLLLVAALADPNWRTWATRVATIYVATIFCFLGGIQWGFALHSKHPSIRIRRLFVGILPSLWAMVALLLPSRLSIIALIVGLALLLTYETLERADHVYPAWYIGLRTRLTLMLVATIGVYSVLPSG